MNTRTIHIPARKARAFEVESGATISIVCPQGEQVADLVGFNLQDPDEYLSVSHTRNMLWRLYLKVGDCLVSNRREALLEIVQDDVGTHDLLCVACDEQRYLLDYGVAGHPNCLANFQAILGALGRPSAWVPDPINIFQNGHVSSGRTLEIAPNIAKPGDQLVMKARKDLLLMVSACPQDLAPTNNYIPKPIDVIVSSP